MELTALTSYSIFRPDEDDPAEERTANIETFVHGAARRLLDNAELQILDARPADAQVDASGRVRVYSAGDPETRGWAALSGDVEWDYAAQETRYADAVWWHSARLGWEVDAIHPDDRSRFRGRLEAFAELFYPRLADVAAYLKDNGRCGDSGSAWYRLGELYVENSQHSGIGFWEYPGGEALSEALDQMVMVHVGGQWIHGRITRRTDDGMLAVTAVNGVGYRFFPHSRDVRKVTDIQAIATQSGDGDAESPTYVRLEGDGTQPQGSHYVQDAMSLVMSFIYEACSNCGKDLDAHVIAPDALGNPHLYCVPDPDVIDAAREGVRTLVAVLPSAGAERMLQAAEQDPAVLFASLVEGVSGDAVAAGADASSWADSTVESGMEQK